MSNIIDYVQWRGDIPLSASPFNEVDSLVLCVLSYLPFELVFVEGVSALTLGQAARTLLTAVEEACSGASARRNRVFLTNDNLSALGFFLRRGYQLEQVHRDAVAALRQHKASIPVTGRAGLPLVDLWELTKPLG